MLLRTTNGSNERLTCRALERRLLPQLAVSRRSGVENSIYWANGDFRP